MGRIALTDGSGRWFDPSKAQSFEEDTRWNGNNHISCATGSQWEHETLYRTPSGRWILERTSQWQGSLPSWEEISAQRAAEWLSINGHDPIPEVAAEYAALEVP